MIDFSIPDEYQEYCKKVVDFAKGELNDQLLERDLQGNFSRDLWKKCAEFGLLKLSVTREYGGYDDQVDIIKAALAMEAFGYGCRDNGLALALNAQAWCVQMSLLTFGNDFQKKKYLPQMASGELIGVHGITEASAGSDAFNMKMSATKVEGGYLLNGEKRLITLAPEADLAIIFANANPKAGQWGITAFIVEAKFKGYQSSPVRSKMGLRTVPIGEITLKDCFVPDENLLGKVGSGYGIGSHSLEFDRGFILTSQLGAMKRQLEETIKFAKERKQYGHPISHFQSVSHRIVDMKVRYESVKLLFYKFIWLKQQNKPAVLEAAMLKLQLSEFFISSSLDTVRNQGGNGYLSEFEIERDLRDAIGGVLYAGTSDIQKNIIATLTGL